MVLHALIQPWALEPRSSFRFAQFARLMVLGPKHTDPTKHDFWSPHNIGPWNHNQNVGSLHLCGLLGPGFIRHFHISGMECF